jgi:VanZ family protein
MIFVLKTINHFLNLRFIRYFSPLACIITIAYLSFGDISDLTEDKISIPHIDKLMHLSMYFTLSYVLLVTRILMSKRFDLHAILFCIAYGIFTELMQSFVFTYRTGDIVDFLFNVGGTITGYFLYTRVKFAKDL